MSAICLAFHQNPTINPRTGRSIITHGPTYNNLVKECGTPGIPASKPIIPTYQVPFPQPTYQVPSPQPTYQVPSPKPIIRDYGILNFIQDIRPAPITSYLTPNLNPKDGDPPEFMSPISIKGFDPKDYLCEGYWSEVNSGEYQPIVSNKPWIGKEEWIMKALTVQNYLKRFESGAMQNFHNRSPGVMHHLGYAPSRIDQSFLGASEYIDGDICWPYQYVEHYIQEHNVPPTERFYHYINQRYATLLR